MLQHPVFAMAFRPLYPLAAVYGAVSILLWAFGWYSTAQLPSYFWHAHEMIWGYAGAIVVAFLLTAVATWTGQPPVRGAWLAGLVGLWLLARIAILLPEGTAVSGVAGTAFFWLAAALMAAPVIRSRNGNNYIAVIALAAFGLSHAVFHLYLAQLSLFDGSALFNGLLAGLLMVSGFVGLIGTRIISFFTSRRLGTDQVANPKWTAFAALLLPLLAAVLTMLQLLPAVAALLAVAAGALGLVQTIRWFEKGVLREPLLWILFAGYLFASLGLAVLGVSQWLKSYTLTSMGVHLIAVGGIGLLTLGMMVRTALGHTGRPLYPAPKPMTAAFVLMLAAAVLRAVSAALMAVNATAYLHSMRLSAVLFALALLLYAYRYLPWLTKPRIDGKAG